MIGTRKTNSIYLIKSLPFVQVLCGIFFIVVGSILLVWNLNKYFFDASFTNIYFAIAFGAIVVGLFILHLSPTMITIINRELRVVTICTRSIFTTSYSQYGYDEINDGLEVTKEYFLGQRCSLHSIRMRIRESGKVSLTGKTYFFCGRAFRGCV